MKAVIMAGGRGSRISNIFSDIPKPLIKIGDEAVIEYGIKSLKSQGFADFIITTSYMADRIIEYLGDGRNYGVNIEYYIEEEPLGNAGALFKIKDKLTEDFLLLNADSIFNIDMRRFIAYHNRKGGDATILTHPNSHPYDSGLVISNKEGCVEQWLTKEDSRPEWYKNRVNAGIHILKKRLIENIHAEVFFDNSSNLIKKVDLDRNILKPLAGTGRLYCYDSPEYVKDMGTPERFESVKKDLKCGLVESKSFCRKQKAIFLDRDGTINKYVGFLRNIEQFELIEGTADAIKKINESGYLAIVVTNQPVIARGEVTENYLEEIHKKMETLLGKNGAYVDAIYYCPHHPDKGYEGEITSLKIKCSCRKPQPGMLMQASQDYNIDLKSSWMVGDSENDILAGISVGCKTALIGNRECGQTVSVDSLLEFSNKILKSVRTERN